MSQIQAIQTELASFYGVPDLMSQSLSKDGLFRLDIFRKEIQADCLGIKVIVFAQAKLLYDRSFACLRWSKEQTFDREHLLCYVFTLQVS